MNASSWQQRDHLAQTSPSSMIADKDAMALKAANLWHIASSWINSLHFCQITALKPSLRMW